MVFSFPNEISADFKVNLENVILDVKTQLIYFVNIKINAGFNA